MEYNPEELIEILNIFKVESDEILQEINDCFLILEKNYEDKASLKKLLMLGFTSIQDISHKLEDIFSMYKKDNINLQNDFQLFYNACDLLSELVYKSVEQKANISSPQVTECINNLNEIISNTEHKANHSKTNKQKNDVKINDDYENLIENNNTNTHKDTVKNNDLVIEKMTDIKAIILELMFVLEKQDNIKQNDLQEIILVVMENLNQLKEIFDNTDFINISNKIDIILKLLRIKNPDIFETCKNNVDELRNDIYNIYQNLNVTIKNMPSVQEEERILSEFELENIIPDKKPDNNIEAPKSNKSEFFDYILNNLSKIKFDYNYIRTLINKQNEIISHTENEKIKNILSKCLDILNYFNNNKSVVNHDCYLVLLQCIYWAKRYFDNKEENLYNYDYLYNRVSVVEEMLKIAEISKQETLSILDTSSSSNALINTTDLQSIRNKLNSLDVQEIKTLRVDTDKLDNLIAQTGELLVNGIKTREQAITLINKGAERLGTSSGVKLVSLDS